MKQLAVFALVLLLTGCADLTGAIKSESDARASAARAQELSAQSAQLDAQTRQEYERQLAASYDRYTQAQEARVREAQLPLVALIVFGALVVAGLIMLAARLIGQRPIQHVTVYPLRARDRPLIGAAEVWPEERARRRALARREVDHVQ
jgi:hypothetical protein